MSVERDLNAGGAVARRFQMRVVELAKQGVFGGLRTRNAALQTSYAHLLSLLDSPEVPVLIYGEKGAGKRRHVNELVEMHDFWRKLGGLPRGKLKVFRGDFVSPGFTNGLLAPQVSEADVIYLEGIDLLTPAGQSELLELLKKRKHFADKGLPLPRLVLGTERALSILMICGEFSRELFQAISGFAVFLPTLKERAEDIPHLVQSFSEEITGRAQTPPAWLVDFFAKRELDGNIDELQRILKHGLARKSDLAKWTSADLPPAYQPRAAGPTFSREPDDVQRYRNALASCRGDRKASAQMLGIPYADFLQKILAAGLR